MAAFVFWYTLRGWLELEVLSKLTKKQTFVLMIVSIVITVLALVGILVDHVLTDNDDVLPLRESGPALFASVLWVCLVVCLIAVVIWLAQRRRDEGYEVRPRAVTRAVTLLYIGWGIGAVLLVTNEAHAAMRGACILELIVVFMISCGKNWARIFYLAMLALSLVFMRFDASLALLDVLAIALHVSAAAFLLTPTAREWFKLGL